MSNTGDEIQNTVQIFIFRELNVPSRYTVNGVKKKRYILRKAGS